MNSRKNMNYKITIVAIIILTTIIGCLAASVHPFYNQKDLVFNEELTGEWIDEEDNKWIFKKSKSEFLYDLAIVQKKEMKLDSNRESGKIIGNNSLVIKESFVAALFKLNDRYFLDLYPKEVEEITFGALHYIPAHSISKIDFNSDTLAISFLQYKWLKNQIEKNENFIEYVKTDDGIALTAPTDELQKMIKTYDDDKKAFSDCNKLFKK